MSADDTLLATFWWAARGIRWLGVTADRSPDRRSRIGGARSELCMQEYWANWRDCRFPTQFQDASRTYPPLGAHARIFRRSHERRVPFGEPWVHGGVFCRSKRCAVATSAGVRPLVVIQKRARSWARRHGCRRDHAPNKESRAEAPRTPSRRRDPGREARPDGAA